MSTRQQQRKANRDGLPIGKRNLAQMSVKELEMLNTNANMHSYEKIKRLDQLGQWILVAVAAILIMQGALLWVLANALSS